MTRSQKFIQDNRKLLDCGKDFYNPDSVLLPAEEFDKRPIRFLLIMPTPSEVKTVSSTLAAMNDFIITSCPNVFIDFAFYPNKNDIKLFDKHSIPYSIGLTTHLDPSHFDIIGFSISVLSEVITAPVCINSFSRCDKPIPLTWTERKDKPLGSVPLILAGGITSSCSDIMFGDLGDGRQSFVDFLYLGSVEKMDFVTDRLEQALQGYGETQEEDKITVQNFIDDLFASPYIYQPQAYKVVFDDDNQVIENTKINPRAQDEVRPYYPKAFDDAMGIGRGYINASGDNAGVSQVQVSEGCSGSGSCIFCHEGFYTGAWVEKTQEQIKKQAMESKKYTASYKFKPYSFNCNYLTDYKGTLVELIQIYPKVSFINMRMEELGNDMDAMRMMKMIGSNRISAPMEGISPRVQNNLLNKNLSESALNNFMNDLIHMKMTDIKVGGIFTAYEKDEDFQWIVDFVSEYKRKAKQEGGNLPFRLKMTPMVHYHLTPCEYIPRKSAEASFWGQRWVKDKWYDAFREAGIFFKVNGFRNSTFLEQCIIDLGRSATQLFYEAIIKDMKPAYSLRSFAIPEVLDALKGVIEVVTLKREEKYEITEEGVQIEGKFDYEVSFNGAKKVTKTGPKFVKGECVVYDDGEGIELRVVIKKGKVNPFYFFMERSQETYISIAHRIHTALEGSGIQKARDLVRAYKDGNIFDAPLQGICLKTFEGAPVVCSAFGARKDPLFLYNDVKLIDGKLHGEYRPLAGCESCSSAIEKKGKLARPTPQTKNSEDLGGVRRLAQTQKIRLLLRRNPSYDLLNPNNTAHTPIAKLLQTSDNLTENFHSMSGHSMFWQSDGDQQYITSGYQIVDTIWSGKVLTELRENIEEANKNLKTVQIVSATEELMEEKIKPEDYNIFYFESSLPYELFSDSRHDYKGEIRIKGGMDMYELKIDKTLKAPQSVNKGKTIGYFAIPAKYNPVAYMAGFFTKAITINKIVASTSFKCVLVVRQANNVCKNCGAEKSTISLITGKSMALGVHCTTMALLTQHVAKFGTKEVAQVK